MPAPGGAVQVMRVLLRSPNHWSSPTEDAESLRRAGRLIFRDPSGPTPWWRARSEAAGR